MRFTLPTMIMMVFTSVYGVVDGFFVSNFAGETPFAAGNFAWPLLMILCAPGFIFGSGGSALISKTLGEGDGKRANRQFSLFVYFSAALGLVLGVAAFIFMRPMLEAIGGDGELLEYSVLYGRIIALSTPFGVLQVIFQSYFSTAEKSRAGLWVTVASGVANMVLDLVFVGLFKWGIVGAAAATFTSQVVGGGVPVIYFARKNTSLLRLGRTRWDGSALARGAANGASEMLSSITASLVGMLYNYQLLRYAGERGVAAYGVLMYVNFIFIAIFIGFTMGTTPIIGFHYGAQNHPELKNMKRKSIVFVLCAAAAMLALALSLGGVISRLFVGYDAELMAMSHRAFMICAFSFPFAGFGIFASAFFTALNNGLVSGVLSGMRTIVFQVAAILLLPLAFGLDGIWFSVVAAEAAAMLASIVALVLFKRRYQY
ncbi:MAG: polysaccharide biosynthesis C-terminal domain-containing protein [Oscillospiraceae bacterium]|nr:polysaccharide biosynthesis C-terminal domain-containing protein [Oscillospiraceae bacterium]